MSNRSDKNSNRQDSSPNVDGNYTNFTPTEVGSQEPSAQETSHGNTTLYVQKTLFVPFGNLSEYDPQPIMTSHVDWFSCTVVLPSKAAMEHLWSYLIRQTNADGLLNERQRTSGKGTTVYKHYRISESGIQMEYARPGERGEEHKEWYIRIQLPGKWLGLREYNLNLKILKCLRDEWFVKCTRIDIAIDLMRDPEVFKLFRHAWENEFFVGADKSGKHVSRTRGNTLNRSKQSETLEIGTRKSPKFIRIYDRAAQQDVPGYWIRYEVEYKAGYAQDVLEKLLDLSDEIIEAGTHDLTKHIASLATGAVDFKDRSSGKQACRCPRFQWWENFINFVGVTLAKLPKQELRSLEEKAESLIRQYAPIIAMLYDAMPRDTFDAVMQVIIQNGKERHRAAHKALIESTKRKGFDTSQISL